MSFLHSQQVELQDSLPLGPQVSQRQTQLLFRARMLASSDCHVLPPKAQRARAYFPPVSFQPLFFCPDAPASQVALHWGCRRFCWLPGL